MIFMAPLSPKARAVIESGRDGLRPTAAERERIEGVLDASAPTPLGAPRLRTIPWRLVAPLGVGFALVAGAALFLAQSRAPLPAPPVRNPTAASASAPVNVVVEPPTALREPAPAASPSPQSASRAPLPRPASSQPEDGLTQEIALLSRAASALRAGRAGDALQVINEHQRKFPNGVLIVERRAVKAQALCSLKRVAEGRAELAQLALNAPAAARAKQICDAAAGPSKD
jgi:hypothetical protein